MVLDNSGSLSQPSSPKHSIRFQRPYAVVTSPAGMLIDVATNDVDPTTTTTRPAHSSNSTSPMLFPRILMSSRPVGSHKIHAKPPSNPPCSVNGVASSAAQQQNSNSVSPSPTLSTGSVQDTKEYARIAQLLNLDPTKIGNLFQFGSKNTATAGQNSEETSQATSSGTSSSSSKTTSSGKAKNGWKSALKEKFSKYSHHGSPRHSQKLPKPGENGNHSEDIHDIGQTTVFSEQAASDLRNNNDSSANGKVKNGAAGSESIYDTIPGVNGSAMSKADLLSVEHFLDLLCRNVSMQNGNTASGDRLNSNNSSSSGSSQVLKPRPVRTSRTLSVEKVNRSRRDKTQCKAVVRAKLDALSVIEECSSSDPELSSLHSFNDGRGEAKASRQEAGIVKSNAEANKDACQGTESSTGVEASSSCSRTCSGTATSSSAKEESGSEAGSCSNNDGQESPSLNVSVKTVVSLDDQGAMSPKIENMSPCKAEEAKANPITSNNPSSNDRKQPTPPRPFTCTHKMPSQFSPRRNLSSYQQSIKQSSENSDEAANKKLSEPFEQYLDGNVEKDYPELASRRKRPGGGARQHRRRHHHHHNCKHRHHHHHHHHSTIMEEKTPEIQKDNSLGACESLLTTVRQPDSFLRKWTERMGRPLPPPSDILLTGSPSMTFADDSGSDPSNWPVNYRDGNEALSTTTGTCTTTSSSNRSDDSDDICEEDPEESREFEEHDYSCTTSGSTARLFRASMSSFLNFSSSLGSEQAMSGPGSVCDEKNGSKLPQISVVPPTPQTFSPQGSEDPCEWDVSDLRPEDEVETYEMIRREERRVSHGSCDDDMVPAIDEAEFGGTSKEDGYDIHRFSTWEDLHQSLLLGSANNGSGNLSKMEPSMRHSTSGELQTLSAVRFLSNRYLMTKRSMSLDTFHVVSKKWPTPAILGHDSIIMSNFEEGSASSAVSSFNEGMSSASCKKKNFQAEFLRRACVSKPTLSRWLEGKLSTGFPRTNPYFKRGRPAARVYDYLSPDTCRYLANPKKHSTNTHKFAKLTDEDNVPVEDNKEADEIEEHCEDGVELERHQDAARKKRFGFLFWHRKSGGKGVEKNKAVAAFKTGHDQAMDGNTKHGKITNKVKITNGRYGQTS